MTRQYNAALVMKRLTLFHDVATCLGLIVSNDQDDCNKKCTKNTSITDLL